MKEAVMKDRWIQIVGAVALVVTCISAQVALVALGDVFRSAATRADTGAAAGPASIGMNPDVT